MFHLPKPKPLFPLVLHLQDKMVLSKTIWYITPSFRVHFTNSCDFCFTFCLIIAYERFCISSTKIFQSSVETSEAARERVFCSCMALSKPASSRLNSFSKNQSRQIDWKPKVSYNSNFAPVLLFLDL
jgi:hypothetical protein